MRDWNDEVADWDEWRLKDYFKWVKETYGKDEVIKGFIYVDGYRAMMDVKNSVLEDPIDRQPTSIITSAGMVKMAQEILNNSMREVIEKHEHNLT